MAYLIFAASISGALYCFNRSMREKVDRSRMIKWLIAGWVSMAIFWSVFTVEVFK